MCFAGSEQKRQMAPAERAEDQDGATYQAQVDLGHTQSTGGHRLPEKVGITLQLESGPDADRTDDDGAATDEQYAGEHNFGPQVDLELDDHADRDTKNNKVENGITDRSGDKDPVALYAFPGYGGVPDLFDWIAREQKEADEDQNIDSVQKDGCVRGIAEAFRRVDTQVEG